MSDCLVSIILRSYNEGWALKETLPALAAQEYRNWELIVIDSGSTDGSAELIAKARRHYFVQIRHEDYNPSRVLNLGMQLARSGIGIFLNADATPQGNDWLRPLVNALQDPQTAAVFGKQIPRPDCHAVFAHDYERCFGDQRASTQWDHFFSMVSSGLRKDIWSQRGFDERMQYSEDDEYTRWCRAQGHRVVYVPESVVMHSHNYTPRQAYRRSFGEARALAAVWTRNPRAVNWPRTVLLGWINDARRDLGFCARTHRLPEWPHAARIRWQQRRAKLAGFRDGWNFYRIGDCSHRRQEVEAEATANGSASLRRRLPDRFTRDGSELLEKHLAELCDRVRDEILSLMGPRRLQALVLGGGYGRGDGGVLKTVKGDRPYNDLEFYLFVRGNRLWNERRFHRPLDELSHRLSADAGLHVEFKVDSLARLRRNPVTMFSYDLVSGHRVIWEENSKIQIPSSNLKDGGAGLNVFAGCEHHLDVSRIPLAEATRLLLNRCTGLLLAKELLRGGELTSEQSDFIGRNLAKAQLALGDAVLTVFGQYHWSCLERRDRLSSLPQSHSAAEGLPWLDDIRRHHAAGVEFKLHPHRTTQSLAQLEREHRTISELARQVWLWLESRRFNREFSSVHDYAFSRANKCPDSATWRNVLLNARTFRANGLRDELATRYPRERLLNSLPLLLWDQPRQDLRVRWHLQNQLKTAATDWPGLVAAYKQVWTQFR